jgi:hypothetical protein
MLALIAAISISADGENNGVSNGWPKKPTIPNLKVLRVTVRAMRNNTLRGGPYALATTLAAVSTLVEDAAKRTSYVVENTVEGDMPFATATTLTFHGST